MKQERKGERQSNPGLRLCADVTVHQLVIQNGQAHMLQEFLGLSGHKITTALRMRM